ncbi:hypothetical protein [Mycobacterium sp. HM-7]
MASLLGVLLALSIPIHLNSVDRSGNPIPCGDGIHPRYDVARDQDAVNLAEHVNRGPAFVASDYAGQCAAVHSRRRSIAIPVGAAGIIMTLSAIGLALRSGLSGRRRTTLPRHASPGAIADAPHPSPGAPASARTAFGRLSRIRN